MSSKNRIPPVDGKPKPELTAEDGSVLEHAICTLCSKVKSSGFYTGCMIADGHCEETGWKCDGNGNLTRKT